MNPNLANLDSTADPFRRRLLLAPLLAALPLALHSTDAMAAKLNPKDTQITLPDQIEWAPWSSGEPGIGDMATLHGGLNKRGLYVVLMRWHPGYMSAPHRYRTDRLSVVLSGTWYVNSGKDFDPGNAVPVPAGGFVERVARTWHYDGVPANGTEPAIIALLGMAPVDLELATPAAQPGARSEWALVSPGLAARGRRQALAPGREKHPQQIG
jgi:hypothetical protein